MMDRMRGVTALFVGYLFGALLMAGWSDALLHGTPLTATVGSVGVQIGVLPNPDNTLAADLRRQEEALHLWEEELRERMAAANATTASQDRTTLALAIGSGALFALVGINFYLDFRDRLARGEHRLIPPFRNTGAS